MKAKRVAWIFIALLIASIACWLYFRQFPQKPASTIAQPISLDENSALSGNGADTAAKATPMTSPDEVVVLQENNFRKLTNAINEGKNEWRTPIEFFGKVVDEDANPVSNADIHFVWTNLSPEGSSEKRAISDTNGAFILRNVTGKVLTVQVSKAGYHAYKAYPVGFFYAGDNENFVPDASNPVIFRLHKKKTAEPLIYVSSRHKIPLNGQPVKINLTSGQIVLSGGDLELKCVSHYEGRMTNRAFDWQLSITVPGGGIVESRQEFDFVAPVTGYTPSSEISMSAAMTSGWQEVVERNFFLKLSNGNFARISFRFFSYNGVLRLESFINPSGSRNLEYDKAVQPKPTVHE